MFEMLGPIGGFLGGLGQAAGGARGLFSSGPQYQDMSTFYQNQFNAQMQQNMDFFDRNQALQREFAQNGIQWRVADAKAAGLHPLAAIGAAGSSYSPSMPVLQGSGDAGPRRVDSGADIGSSLANMGQGLGRAIAATQTQEAKAETAFEIIRKSQELERGDLSNQILVAQLRKLNEQPSMPGVMDRTGVMSGQAPGVGVGFGSAGVGGEENARPQIATNQPGNPGLVSGRAQPDTQFHVSPSGSYHAYPAKGSMDDTDVFNPLFLRWALPNMVGPNFSNQQRDQVLRQMKHDDPAVTGAYWDHYSQGWRPLRNNEKAYYERSINLPRMPNNSPREYHGSY